MRPGDNSVKRTTIYFAAVPLSSWLFIRGSESIWVERPYGSVLVVAGPGSLREQREFIDDATLNAFQVAFAERLAAEGWFLWDYNRERRTGVDRRHTLRTIADRRHRIELPT